MPRSRPRDEQGSIAVSMMIMFIATAVTAALLTTVFRDVRVSRRAGDSANALQVADAGVNEAVKAVRNAAGTVGACSMFPTLPGFSRTSTIAGGSYAYCAAQEVDADGRPIWHIDSTGTDATGVQRHLRADAVAEPRFPEAIFVMSAAKFDAGFSVDSYKDEVNRCTRKGRVGSNDPASLTFGSEGQNTSENCQNEPNGAWPYPPDGCVAYSRDGSVTFPADKIGIGQCPPSHTTTDSPEFFRATATSTGPVDFPAAPATSPGANFTCDNTTTLQPGKTYYYASVTLAKGCTINTAGLSYPAQATPVKIFTQNLKVAGGTGSSASNVVNAPPDDAAVCGASHGASGADKRYCPGWAGALQIEVMAGGSAPEVKFTGNHATFWGVINAPSATATWTGGAPQWEIFGSMVVKSVVGGVQAMWHYDETLGALTTGRFFGKHWREEPLP
ncbi:MAG TPA: hypothetical protein VK975_04020 [Acidimicrobiales bacterium]|nr:hypothetical protein [Acidimicrobiales bacterium]